MAKTLKYIYVVTITIMLLLPAIHYFFDIPHISNTWLAGKTEDVHKPVFHLKDWKDESYQKQLSAFLEFKAGYKPWLVRLNNEWQFRIFKDADNDVIVGKDNTLYLKPYIDSYTGADLQDYQYIYERSKRARQLQKIADSLGKKCLFIIAPGKASFTAAQIPDKFLKNKKDNNNYQQVKKGFNEMGIEHIDLYDWFLQQRGISQFPLFPKYGTHWSVYGGGLALDSIADYLARTSQIRFPRHHIDSIRTTEHPEGTDGDLLDLMNILTHELPSGVLAYPHYAADPAGSGDSLTSPRILVIGDSYIWTFHHSGLMPLLAGNKVRYWYYGNSIYNQNAEATGFKVTDKDIKEMFANYDVVLFVFTEISETYFDYDLAEKFLKAEKPANSSPQ